MVTSKVHHVARILLMRQVTGTKPDSGSGAEAPWAKQGLLGQLRLTRIAVVLVCTMFLPRALPFGPSLLTRGPPPPPAPRCPPWR